MFTGIIEDLGTIESVEIKAGISRLRVKSKIFGGQKIGDSIAVNGACLTVAELKNDTAGFDVMAETRQRSILGQLKRGDAVNLERALKAGDRMGGHFVAGHIDCAGKVSDLSRPEKPLWRDSAAMSVKIPKEYMKFVVEKGSIALDGISLTVGEVGADRITAYLIPHTIKNTTLGFKRAGDEVNIEFDLLGKYALRAKEIESSRITEDFLREKGFR